MRPFCSLISVIWLLVALGGAVGSVLRYGAGRLAAYYLGADTVVGTLAVNVAGSFALVIGWPTDRCCAMASDWHLLPGGRLATLAVNVAGSFALGLLATVFISRTDWPLELRAMPPLGFGGFTTFSTLAYDGVRLVSGGELGRAGISIAANLVIGLAAAYAGVLLGRALS